ncbi:MAG: ABC transporter permease [Acidobacteria bacterium]|nr:ABC transporter permease [Acidobacteriota bacterium]
MRLLLLLSWPHARRHLLRTVLTTAGVVLGIAVFVGMYTANQSVLLAFSQTIERIAGKTELQVTAGEAGFGEDVLDTIQSSSLVRVAVPVIEAVVDPQLRSEGDLLVLGIDMTGDRSLRDYDLDSGDEAIVDDPLVFLAQPDSLIVSKDLADRNGLSVGSRLPLQTADGNKNFTVRGIMRPEGLATAFGGNLAIMDVYAAQHMFGRGRTFDRIDLALAPGATIEQAEKELSTLLGPGFDVQAPAGRGRQAEAMVAGYTMMVNISSVFALFIGMFIIYNSFATAVTERRAEIGILRALGATRGQVRRVFLTESLALGLVGSLAGLVAGAIIARGIASAISNLVGELYGVANQATEVATDPLVMAVAIAIGMLTSVVAAAIPARSAARVDPIHALRKGSHQVFSAEESRLRMVIAAGLALVAAASLLASESRLLFFAGYACTIAAAVLVGPTLTVRLTRALRPLLTRIRAVEGALAADSVIQAPRRTSGSVAALMLSLALIIAFGGMARASYGSIVQWMDAFLNPDLFVMPSQRLDVRTTRFPATMAPEIASLPGVERVQMFRNNRIMFRGKPAMVAALEMNSVRETGRSVPVAGNVDEMYAKAAAGTGVIVADIFSQLHDVHLGDVVEIPAPYGTLALPVVGIVVDFVDQQGTVFVDRSVFLEYWHDDTVSDFRVFVASGADLVDVRQRIIERFAGERHVFVLTNDEARQYVLRVADQWFSLMNVQIFIAVLVAILGIVNTLTVSITDRRRELGVLKAVGAVRAQIRGAIWLEAATVAVIGLVLGALLGAINLYYLLEIVQRDAVGLRLDYQYPTGTLLALVPIMLGAALVAALWPSEAAARRSPVEALAYE